MHICTLSFTINCNEVPLSSDVNKAKCYVGGKKPFEKTVLQVKITVFYFPKHRRFGSEYHSILLSVSCAKHLL